MTGKHKLNVGNVVPGNMMAFVYYTRVRQVRDGGTELIVEDVDDSNNVISVRGKDLIEKSFSADQYLEEVREAKTRVAEILIHSPNRPLTVCFEKSDGTERVLRGRFVKSEPLLGRSMVEDLDVAGGERLRQVDHRSLKWLICDGVKHVVK